MNHTVIGIFDSEKEANTAVEQLVSRGLSRSNIDYCSKNAFAQESGNNTNKLTDFFGSVLDKEDDVKNYANVARQGCTVTVHATSLDQAQLAADVMDLFGAVDVNERAMQQTGNTAYGQSDAGNADTAIPVIEEELQVGKRVVQTGGVRLRSRIIERAVEEHLRLREEHVHIERQPVNQVVSPADLDAFREETIEVTQKAEVPVVAKEARVVEEVSLNKEIVEHDEVVRDTVRHTEVDVEKLQGNADVTGSGIAAGSTGAAHTDADTSFLDKSHQNWSNALHRMKEVEDDYKVASDDPDVRGWDVVDATNTRLGEVNELIVDTDAMKVRYLEVDVDTHLLDSARGADRRILIPIGAATLDTSNKNVMVSTLNTQLLANYPAYGGESITREYEHGLLSALSPAYKQGSLANDRFYEGEHFDSGRFYGSKNQ
jgi:uncharacterized protein (TIGR02271 family)